ncbi:hypothetical protein ACLK1S_16230 [Escherichia coli]
MYGRVNGERLYRSGALPVLEKCPVQSEVGVAKGKKQHDKSWDIKDARWQVDKARIMKKRPPLNLHSNY